MNIRAQAVANVPFVLESAGGKDVTEQKEYEWITKKLKTLLYQTEASLDLYASSYWIQERNRMGTKRDVRWIVPTNVLPKIGPAGLTEFERTIDGVAKTIKLEQIVYIWVPSLTADIGPGVAPVQVALSAAGILANLQIYLENYFARGALKASILKVPKGLPATEKEKLESWWKRLIGGSKNSGQAVAISADVVIDTIGDALKDTVNKDLTIEQREDIATALGVPHSLVASNAANFATAEQDSLNFYNLTILPQCELIAEAINEQLFKQLNIKLVFKPQKLEVMQSAEVRKAVSIMQLVGKPVLTIDEGRALMGYDPIVVAEEPTDTKSAVYEFDVSGGTISKNERREQLGLEPIDDSKQAKNQELLAMFAMLKAGTEAGLTLDAVAELLGVTLPKVEVPEVKPEEVIPEPKETFPE